MTTEPPPDDPEVWTVRDDLFHALIADRTCPHCLGEISRRGWCDPCGFNWFRFDSEDDRG